MAPEYGSVHRSEEFIAAVQLFLSAADEVDGTNYIDDATEMAALTLGLRAEEWFTAAFKLQSENKYDLSKKAGEQGLQLLLQADKLLVSHSLHRLDRWIDIARASRQR